MERGIIPYLSSRLSPTLEFLEFQESMGLCYHMRCQCLSGICLSSRCIFFAADITVFPDLLKSIARKTYLKGYLASVSTTVKGTHICNKDENFFHVGKRCLRSSEFTTSSLATVIFVLRLKL